MDVFTARWLQRKIAAKLKEKNIRAAERFAVQDGAFSYIILHQICSDEAYKRFISGKLSLIFNDELTHSVPGNVISEGICMVQGNVVKIVVIRVE